ncbi:MAG: hypothetical protein JOZ16_08645 [Methylobacteriaceae bacterium]|nr:hypothetical protein [Methylobacteriaceae bacterium]
MLGRPTVQEIQTATASVFGRPLSQLLGSCRRQETVRVRDAAIAITRRLTKFSSPEIGARFKRDHTTILDALARFPRHCHQDRDYCIKVRQAVAIAKSLAREREAREAMPLTLPAAPKRPRHVVTHARAA